MKDTSIYNIPKVIRPRITWTFNPAIDGTTILGKSMTVPDQTLSLKELLEKFTNGMPMPEENGGFYEENPDIADMDLMQFNRLDISEKMEIIEEIQKDQKRAMEILEQQAKEQAEKEALEQAKKETPKLTQKQGKNFEASQHKIIKKGV